MRDLTAASLITLLLSSCTTVTPAMDAVQIVGTPQAIQGCRFIKNVRGDQNMLGGYLLAGAAYEDAIRQMKKRTVEAGGNRLYVITASTGLTGANAMGDAYKC